MSNLLKVTPTEVNITPNGEISWLVSNVDGGKLYTPSSRNTNSDNPMHLINHYLGDSSYNEIIGYGGEGIVYDVAGYALKHYNAPFNPGNESSSEYANTYGLLPDLRANVALTEGLKQVEQVPGIEFDVHGVEVHAVYIPDESDEQTQALWLMERLTDTGTLYGEWLDNQQRMRIRRLYDAALNLFDIPDYAVEYDDQHDVGNTMVSSLPTADGRGKLVKYDSYALESWLDF